MPRVSHHLSRNFWTAWLAVLPVLYVLSPLALAGLYWISRMPGWTRWILLIYMGTQLLPALLSPEPALNIMLALGRTALIGGLLGTGMRLGNAEALKPLGAGLVIVYATAILFTATGGTQVIGARLAHPFMTPISLGLLGAFGVWMALFLPASVVWRALLGTSGLAVLLLSGSRGPLAAAVIGVICGLGMRYATGRSWWRVPVGATVVAATFVVFSQFFPTVTAQLTRTDVTGRDAIWLNTVSVIQQHPLSGVGSYRLGTALGAPGNACELFADAQGEAASCPAWLVQLGSPWLIAHNLTLQQLAETGPLGMLGLAVLLGGVMAVATIRRDSFSLAVLSGYIIMSVNDNVLLVPSAGVAELFWITAGLNLIQATPSMRRAALMATGILIVVSQPLLSLLTISAPVPVTRGALVASQVVDQPDGYVVIVDLRLPAGQYRAVLRSCTGSCKTVTFTPFGVRDVQTQPAGYTRVRLAGTIRDQEEQQIQLLIYPQAVGGLMRPISQSQWTVRMKP